MQFKHPELLYALFLLLIPIIVHLFQLRKFQKVAFTNVAFLKEATIQTRKSSRIKKWLILFTRLLLLAFLIFAFAQPFTSKSNTFKTERETVIYLDNSFSMQAKGSQGELLKRAIQDIITNVPNEETISIITNDQLFKNTSINAIKNELLKLDYSANRLSSESALLKCKTHFSNKKGVLKHVVFISDFQDNDTDFNPKKDSLTTVHLVKIQPVNKNNISVDSVFISETSATTLKLVVALKSSGNSVENLPVSLYNNQTLIAKTAVDINKTAETTFSIPVNETIQGKITIEDAHLQFDNTLYIDINKSVKTKVLAVNAADDDFLKRIYTPKEFNYSSTPFKQLNYSIIDDQQLIILNELDNIPVALTSALKQFTSQGGSVIVIPSKSINLASYNQLLANSKIKFTNLVSSKKRITTINYSHLLYNNGVFEEQVKNFQYPKVQSFYGIAANHASSALQFEDGKTFLTQRNNTYVFTSPLNTENSNFKNSPLIVPTFYNIAKQSFKTPELYYTIGKENTFDIETEMQQDAVLTLVKDQINLIPRQQYFNNKVKVFTSDEPSISGSYAVMNKNETVKNISYNYSRHESNLTYRDLSALNNITASNSITHVFDTIKSETKVNALWKWFVIFALALLIIEMLILKFFK
jgi:hypothetical protein